jgi:hypothetical protein
VVATRLLVATLEDGGLAAAGVIVGLTSWLANVQTLWQSAHHSPPLAFSAGHDDGIVADGWPALIPSRTRAVDDEAKGALRDRTARDLRRFDAWRAARPPRQRLPRCPGNQSRQFCLSSRYARGR